MPYAVRSLNPNPGRLSRSGALLGGVLVSLMACATNPAPPRTLAAMQNQHVKQLVARCFAENEGFRLVHGDATIYLACRNRAEASTKRTAL